MTDLELLKRNILNIATFQYFSERFFYYLTNDHRTETRYVWVINLTHGLILDKQLLYTGKVNLIKFFPISV